MSAPEIPSFQFSLPPEFYEDIDRRIAKAVAAAISDAKPETKSPYLTRKEVCAILHITLPTLYRLINKGTLQAKKIGNRILFDEQAIKKELRDLPIKSR